MKISKKEYELISYILDRTLNAYNEDGSLSDDYYNNIILNDLSEKELKILKEF